MLAETFGELLGRPIIYRDNVQVNCPFPDHADREASMSLGFAKGMYNCFGCGRKGTLRQLAQILGGEVNEADIALSLGRDEPEEEKPDFICKYNEFEINQRVIGYYLKERQLSSQVPIQFGFRTNALNIVMPYFDGDRVAALRYRGMNAKKYYEHGSERIIYNVNDVRGKPIVVLAEGESDTHALWDTITDYNVGVGGVPGANSSIDTWELWALDLIWATMVYLAFDNDDAGNKGAERAASVLGDKARRLAPPAGYKDWADALMHGQGVTL